jgi:hypothetical protein
MSLQITQFCFPRCTTSPLLQMTWLIHLWTPLLCGWWSCFLWGKPLDYGNEIPRAVMFYSTWDYKYSELKWKLISLSNEDTLFEVNTSLTVDKSETEFNYTFFRVSFLTLLLLRVFCVPYVFFFCLSSFERPPCFRPSLLSMKFRPNQ